MTKNISSNPTIIENDPNMLKSVVTDVLARSAIAKEFDLIGLISNSLSWVQRMPSRSDNPSSTDWSSDSVVIR